MTSVLAATCGTKLYHAVSLVFQDRNVRKEAGQWRPQILVGVARSLRFSRESVHSTKSQ